MLLVDLFKHITIITRTQTVHTAMPDNTNQKQINRLNIGNKNE